MRSSGKDLALTVVAGVVTALITALILDALAQRRDAAAQNPQFPRPIAPGQATV